MTTRTDALFTPALAQHPKPLELVKELVRVAEENVEKNRPHEAARALRAAVRMLKVEEQRILEGRPR